MIAPERTDWSVRLMLSTFARRVNHPVRNILAPIPSTSLRKQRATRWFGPAYFRGLLDTCFLLVCLLENALHPHSLDLQCPHAPSMRRDGRLRIPHPTPEPGVGRREFCVSQDPTLCRMPLLRPTLRRSMVVVRAPFPEMADCTWYHPSALRGCTRTHASRRSGCVACCHRCQSRDESENSRFAATRK